jgi:hypothetical protein
MVSFFIFWCPESFIFNGYGFAQNLFIMQTNFDNQYR